MISKEFSLKDSAPLLIKVKWLDLRW